jgi:hypothetical protein
LRTSSVKPAGRKSSQASWAGQFGCASCAVLAGHRPTQAKGVVRLQIKTTVFGCHEQLSFSNEKNCVFLKKLSTPLRDVEFEDEYFGSLGKILNFSVRE